MNIIMKQKKKVGYMNDSDFIERQSENVYKFVSGKQKKESEDEEYFQDFLKRSIAYSEKNKNSLWVVNKEAEKRFFQIMEDLKTILENETNFDEYEIRTQKYDFLPTKITIIVEVESFGTNRDNHSIYRNIIENSDAFEADWLTNGKIRFFFGIHNMFEKISK